MILIFLIALKRLSFWHGERWKRKESLNAEGAFGKKEVMSCGGFLPLTSGV